MTNNSNRWKFLFTACLVNFCTGSIYAWSVFAGPKAEQMSQLNNVLYTAGDLAIVFGLANAVGPLPMIFGGFINDRFGPGWLMTIGGLLIGSGLFLAGSASDLGSLILSYSLLFGLGLGLTYGATINTCVKLFPDRRGFAGGMATAFYGLCSVVLPPIAHLLTTNFGIQKSFEIVGAVCGAVICAGGLLCRQNLGQSHCKPCSIRLELAGDDCDKAVLEDAVFLVLRSRVRNDDHLAFGRYCGQTGGTHDGNGCHCSLLPGPDQYSRQSCRGYPIRSTRSLPNADFVICPYGTWDGFAAHMR